MQISFSGLSSGWKNCFLHLKPECCWQTVIMPNNHISWAFHSLAIHFLYVIYLLIHTHLAQEKISDWRCRISITRIKGSCQCIARFSDRFSINVITYFFVPRTIRNSFCRLNSTNVKSHFTASKQSSTNMVVGWYCVIWLILKWMQAWIGPSSVRGNNYVEYGLQKQCVVPFV